MNQKPFLFEIVSRPVEAEISLVMKGSERYPCLIAERSEVSSSKVDEVVLLVSGENREAII